MDDLNKPVADDLRRSALRLVLAAAFLGALLGFGLGLVAAEFIGTRIVVNPPCGSGIEV